MTVTMVPIAGISAATINSISIGAASESLHPNRGNIEPTMRIISPVVLVVPFGSIEYDG